MELKRGFLKQPKTVGRTQHRHQQQLEPIPVSTEVLTKVLSYLPRAERARLCLTNSQMAQSIVPGVNAERQKVSLPLPPPSPKPLTDDTNFSFSPPHRACFPISSDNSRRSSSRTATSSPAGLPFMRSALPRRAA